MINKFRYMLSIAIIAFTFFEPVFAVKAIPISKDNPEYQILIGRFPDVDAIMDQLTSAKSRDSIPAILKVRFDGIPECAIFLSGQNTYPSGGICPLSIFQKDAFEKEAAQLLSSHSFPLEKFNFAMLLVAEKSNILGKAGRLSEQRATLEKKYRNLEQFEKETRESGDRFEKLEKAAKYLNELCLVRQEAIKYLMDYAYEISLWEQLSKIYVGSAYAKDAATSDIDSIKKVIETIDGHKGEAAEVMRFIEKDPFFAQFLLCYGGGSSPKEDEKQAQAGFLKLFCRYWEKEAEDALIFKILQNLEKYDRIPRVIEIYGNKDPCFQCQVKLQWLADNLAKKIIDARKRHSLPIPTRAPEEKLTILYYAKDECQAPCLHVPLGKIAPWKLATRKESEMGQIMRFEFIEGDMKSLPVRAFTPLSMRMLRGGYSGKIVSIDNKKKILAVEITESKVEWPPTEVQLTIDTPEELCAFYNRKKIYIGSLQPLGPLHLEPNQYIRFEIIDDRTMDTELSKKGGVFGVADGISVLPR